MTDKPLSNDGARVLDPIDRNSEILFGLFMVLTFTGTLSVASAGREEVRAMTLAAIGCTLAWGLVDGIMYLLRSLIVRSRQARMLRAVLATDRPEQAHRLISEEIGPLSDALGEPELERIRQWLVARPAHETPTARLTRRDLRAAFGVFMLVFASTFPVVLPFLFFSDLRVAMRVSGAIAIAMMFLCGFEWGRYGGLRPWRAGLIMVLLGVSVEVVVIALGG